MWGRSFYVIRQGIDQRYRKRRLALPVFPMDIKNGIVGFVKSFGIDLVSRHPLIGLMGILSNLLLIFKLVL